MTVLWVGIVHDSHLVDYLRPMVSSHMVLKPTHFVIPTKECVVEVVAENVDVLRLPGSPREAVARSLE